MGVGDGVTCWGKSTDCGQREAGPERERGGPCVSYQVKIVWDRDSMSDQEAYEAPTKFSKIIGMCLNFNRP